MKDRADKAVDSILAEGHKAIAVQGSVAIVSDVTRLFDETIAYFGKIDILVNNAGVCSFGLLSGFEEAEYRRQFDTNVLDKCSK